MDKIKLGNSDLSVSKICLGTMTFGEQNTESESHAILDTAVECDINFIDTAEMYPIMARPETYGLTETIIGKWLKNKRREDFVIASKMVGVNNPFTWIRNGGSRFNKEQITEAIDNSLKRLSTDYIDLYQLHWPDRNTVFFGEKKFNREREQWFPNTPIPEVLEALNTAVQAGKIRYIGVSNENSWGVCQFTKYAEQLNLPRIVSIQNGYSLVNRSFEFELDEACYRENVSLLAYSPLSFGTLTGKYIENPHAHARMNIFPKDWSPRYIRPTANTAIEAYCNLAKKYSITPTELALSWVYTRPFVASTLIGGTSVEHIKYNRNIINTSFITEGIEKEINELHLMYADPAK
jgi:aryl-alcohol dehydrogenase-like predicted oxidoreductase